jgi:hypothetical protein
MPLRAVWGFNTVGLVFSYLIGTVLSLLRGELSRILPSEAISSGSNVRTALSTSSDIGFQAIAGHGETGSFFRIELAVC